MSFVLPNRSRQGPWRVLVVFGTRPEAIKMLPVVKALRARPELAVTVATTGQHRQMLDQVFEVFGEKPDIDLDLMTHAQSLADITVRVISRMEAVLAQAQPDLLLVHGDTTTAMAAALAGFYARVPIGHVEAGLRSHDVQRPWPEEYNRVSIDAVADLLFAPTQQAVDVLHRESPRERGVFLTGNTGIDALLQTRAALKGGELAEVPLDGRRLILVTGHRRESFGRGFEDICDALARLSDRPDVQIVYPVHLNPTVRGVVNGRLAGRDNLHLIEPVQYAQMVALMERAHVILTDSGGVQEEAPALGKPVLVMREVTERPEAVATGVASLVGTDPDRIVSEVGALLDDEQLYAGRARPVFPYGDGKAAERIARIIVEALEG